MSNLSVLERILGSLDLWPRDILRYLFLVPPTLHTIREVALFFHGNDIPLALAAAFFQECPVSSDSLALLHYFDFAFHTPDPYNFEYYDMTFGAVVRYVDRHVSIDARNGQIPIGFGDGIFPPDVMTRIANMRQ